MRLLGPLLFLLILAAAAGLRFHELDDRPLHADEATAAHILGKHLESCGYTFDPKHFHGPMLLYATSIFLDASGENPLRDIKKGELRFATALASLLTIASFALFLPWLKWSGVLTAAALATLSPIHLYYGRMWIHESIFTLFAILTLAALFHYLRSPSKTKALIFGIAVGLMFATRETVVISLAAWSAAGLFILVSRKQVNAVRTHIGKLILSIAAFFAIATLFYSSFGSNLPGIIDAFSTYFNYELTSGHEKPFLWYLELMLWPSFNGGVHWHELPIFIIAVTGLLFLYPRRRESKTQYDVAIFIGISTLLHWLFYSLIAYKTPWLILLTWTHLFLVAACGASIIFNHPSFKWRAAYVFLLSSVLNMSYEQAAKASFIFHSDARNPYAYSPTSSNVEALEFLLDKLRKLDPELASETIAIIGPSYWPLPWYLKNFDRRAYWNKPHPGIKKSKLIIAMPGTDKILAPYVGSQYEPLPYGLRYEYPLTLYVRNDLWEVFQNETH